MCGIAGFYGFNDRALLAKMLGVIVHRGPDDEGTFFDNNLALGNRRLSIIDIKGGHQPIHNEDESIWIVYNGEIYNFRMLREELENAGHTFYTHSDTEVVVHAYEEYGTNCLQKFNGMFAFALWDKNNNKLFLARDRIGIKPLYYYWDSEATIFIFASEIKAILQYTPIKRRPNERMVYEFLYAGAVDTGPDTFFDGILRLLPAHYMYVDQSGIRIERYWELTINRKYDFSAAKPADIEKFRELLIDAVRLRLMSEVPVGTCLSGGLDSTPIVCIINNLLKTEGIDPAIIGERQKTFSAVYADKSIDERKYIEEVIAFTDAEKNYVFPSSKRLWADLRKLVYHMDEPFQSTSMYAQWEVMKLASKKVTVVLDGQGGDELLAGYLPYYIHYLWDILRAKKLFLLLKELIAGIDLILPIVIYRYVPILSKYLPKLIRKHLLARKELDITEMLDPEFVRKYQHTRQYGGGRVGDLPSLVNRLKSDMTVATIPHLLRYEDRNSMAFSIEARVPFLDHRLVEYVFSLSPACRIKDGWTKAILRAAMKGVIPESIRSRRSKYGYATPESKWLRELSTEIRALFASNKFKFRGYFNPEAVLKNFDKFCSGKLKAQYSRVFWRIINLEIWLQVFFDNMQVVSGKAEKAS
jgi:asparagine synthase (glutamine-hydrolysing)